jgi:hypothetical protein
MTTVVINTLHLNAVVVRRHATLKEDVALILNWRATKEKGIQKKLVGLSI